MRFFNRKESHPPVPQPQRTALALVEYQDHETGNKHWDVKLNDRSITDDYGFRSLDEAKAAYVRRLAIERGEIRIGFSQYTIEEILLP